MKRTPPALLLAVAALLATSACGGEPADVSGDSVTENDTTQSPAPVPS